MIMLNDLQDDLLKDLDYQLLHYGTILIDEDYQRVRTECDRIVMENVRTRIIKYGGRIYYHKMLNGKLILLFELK